MFGKTPRGYKAADCCYTCENGSGSDVNPGWYCYFFGYSVTVQKHCVCDGWERRIEEEATEDYLERLGDEKFHELRDERCNRGE